MRGDRALWIHSHDSRFRVARRSSASVCGAGVRIERRVTIATRIRGGASVSDTRKCSKLFSRAEDQCGGVETRVFVKLHVVEVRAAMRADRSARISARRNATIHAEKPFHFARDLSGITELLAADDGAFFVWRAELRDACVDRHFDRHAFEHAAVRALADVVPRADASFGRAMHSDLRA